MATVPDITVHIDAPSRGASNFDTAMATALANLDTMIDQLNAAVAAINDLAWLGTGEPAVVFALDTGAADAYAMAPALPLAAYDPTKLYLFKAAHANTGASTLAVSGLAAKAIVDASGAALTSGAIDAGQEVLLAYVESADKFMLVGGGASFGIGTDGQVLKTVSGASAWTDPNWTPTTAFTRTGDGSGTVTDNAANQALFAPGRPLRAKSGTTYTYHLVTAYSSGTVTVAGPALPATIDELDYGDFTRVASWPGPDSGTVNGAFAQAADSQMLADYLLQSTRWQLGRAHCVRFSIRATSADSGAAQSRVNLKIGSNAVATTNSNAGLAVSASGWVDTTTDIDATKCTVGFGDALELVVDANGTNKDAMNLSYQAAFILE